MFTPNGTYTYAEVEALACAVSHFLIASGGRKGDRALLLSDNGFFWVAAYLGTLRAGLVSVPLPAKINGDDLRYIVSTTEPRFAFVEARSAARCAPALRKTTVVLDRPAETKDGPVSLTIEELRAQGTDNKSEAVNVGQDDLAALMFTSGSTGKPRGVMVAAGNIVANTNSIIDYLRLTSADRIMDVLPFHYCFGASLLHTHLRVGGSIVIETRFMYPESILQKMLQMQCTGFAGVPSHFQILLRRSSIAKKRFPSLRYVQQAGGHLAPAFVKELREALPGTDIFVMYGQTEATARLSYLPPGLLDAKPGSAGKAIPGVKLTVQNESGRPVRPGEIGEIVAEGDNIALGYWRDQHETAKSFRDGRLHTGDLATVDEDGFIFIVDRAKDFLKCGGQRVSCRYVEDILLECSELVEAAVVGVPDDVLGEAVKAFVVPRNRDHDSICEHVQAFCQRHLAPVLLPREIVVLDSLPKNTSGKVMKQLLREPLTSFAVG